MSRLAYEKLIERSTWRHMIANRDLATGAEVHRAPCIDGGGVVVARLAVPGRRQQNMNGAVPIVSGESGGGDPGGAFGGSTRRALALSALLIGLSARGAEEVHTVPHVPPASAEGHVGVLRIESRSAFAGAVRIVAVDDAGRRTEAGELTLGARAAVEFDAAALESGDASLGLSGTGPGEGGWRLELATELDIEARAYARSEDLVTALHDAVRVSGEEVELPLFRPGGAARRSVLRLVNAGSVPAAVKVRGIDDAGRAGGAATAELGPWEARSYAAWELEDGAAAGLSGSLGGGEGSWRLLLQAERGSAYAVNLLLDGSGIVSSVPGGMSRGAGLHRVPLFPPEADGAGRRGLVRAVNRAAAPAEVRIEAYDATDRAREAPRLALGAGAAAEFDSSDLERGNAGKGLEGGTGPGEGDWWLELSSGSDIEVLSYLEAAGTLSPVRGSAGVETGSGMRYEALLWEESGELRLLNAGGEPVEVKVSGTDDAGAAGGEVLLALDPWSARTLSAAALERGAEGLSGSLGAGTGSWRLALSADGEIDVLSLARGDRGGLSDVSRRGRPAGAPPRVEVVEATASADLWARASASETRMSPGEAFELTATAGNRGARAASPTTLRYRRSADAAISGADAEVGTDSVPALAPGDDARTSLALSAPPEPGTHYYGACVDSVPEETNAANNCSPSVQVTVTEPPDVPDLVVLSPSVSNRQPAAGETLILSATVSNQGSGAAASTTLRYYRSADATISTADTPVGTDDVAGLGSAGSSDEMIDLDAPQSPGTYHYGACVDHVPGESDASNNCSAAVAATVPDSAAPTTRYGAVSLAIINCGEGGPPNFAWGLVVDQESKEAAIERAIQECIGQGGSEFFCSVFFPRLSFTRCAAVAGGYNSVKCSIVRDAGDSRKQAEDNALAWCFLRENSTCYVLASACNSTD